MLNRQDGKDEYHVPDASLGEGVDPRKSAGFDHRVLLPRGHYANEQRMMLGYQAALFANQPAENTEGLSDSELRDLVESPVDIGDCLDQAASAVHETERLVGELVGSCWSGPR